MLKFAAVVAPRHGLVVPNLIDDRPAHQP